MHNTYANVFEICVRVDTKRLANRKEDNDSVRVRSITGSHGFREKTFRWRRNNRAGIHDRPQVPP